MNTTSHGRTRARRADAHTHTRPFRATPTASLHRTAAALIACAALLVPSFVARGVGASGPVKAGGVTTESPHDPKGTSAAPSGGSRDVASKRDAIESAYGRLPVAFVANDGQLDPSVAFSARGAGYQLFLTDAGAVLSLDVSKDARARSAVREESRDADARAQAAVLRMKLAGARRASSVSGERPLEGRANYFVGSDPSEWRTNVETYSAVRYEGVYPGVDLIYHGDQRQLEYDFRLAPGADSRQIRIAFDGARTLKIDAQGQLLLRVGDGYVTQHKPVAYQIAGGARREIAARYRLGARGGVGFRLGRYDHALPLVIDPVVSYSTYLGGSLNDTANAVAVDSAGNAYVTGQTTSTNFPVLGALQSARAGRGDVFVTKINPAGTALVYSTYLGGSFNDTGYAIAVDAAGDAYVTGATFSTDFPHTAGAFQPTKPAAAGSDAFVAKLNPAGNALLYSTYLGGNNGDDAHGIGIDAAGNAYVVGATNSTIFNGAPLPKRGSPAYRSTDAGATWAANNSGINDAAITGIAVDPINHLTLYAAAENAVYKSTDGGSTWAATAPLPPISGGASPPQSVTVDPVTPSTVYVASFFGIYKSTDAGGSWTISEQGSPVQQVAVDPNNHLTLYAATIDGVIKSTDGGAAWADTSSGVSGIPGTASGIACLVVDPIHAGTIYAGTDAGVYKTTNGGLTWGAFNTGMTTSVSQPTLAILSLVIDPVTPTTLYASANDASAKVFKTTDGGAHWQATAALPVVSFDCLLAIDPVTPAIVYAAGSQGVFKTTDGGAHWATINNGLSNRYVDAVAVDPVAPSRVFVGTEAFRDAFAAKLNSSGGALGYFVLLGGDEDDAASAVAVDAAGDAHIAGTTSSTNFPTANALSATSGGLYDAFVAKLTPAGSVAYATYLGGDGSDTGAGIALDGQGRAYVTGYTSSSNFPVTIARKQPDTSRADIYLARFSPGGALDYSFLYGGTGFDSPLAVAADASGNAYVTGQTDSADFPQLAPVQAAAAAGAFLVKFDPSGGPALSTYLGGSPLDTALAVAADANGGVYVVGSTNSASFPVTTGAFQTARGGSTDGFAAKFQIGDLIAPQVSFSQPTYSVSEAAARATLTLVRSGDASQPLTVSYQTVDDPAPVRCDDTVNNHGAAYARCDYATTIDSVTFAANDTTPKQINVPIIDDSHVEGDETFQVRLFNPVGATLASPSTARVIITDNDTAGEANPIFNTDFFVRQQYLDFLSREPEAGQPWTAVLNNCAPNDTSCDRVSVSANFFRSQEFQLKGLFVFRFYKVAFGRLPTYAEIVADMRAVTGTTTAELVAKKGAFTTAFAQRQDFKAAYDGLDNASFVNALMGRYNLQQVTTRPPSDPDGGQKTVFSRAAFADALNFGTMTRAQVLRAVADSDEVGAAEFNGAFVAMQYFGYLRRDPEADGYANWLRTINANPGDIRSMVNGFVNSTEYRLRFGQP